MSDNQNSGTEEEISGQTEKGGTESSAQRRVSAKLVSEREAPVEIYVDGVAGLSVRAGVAKIDCYSVSPHEQSRNEPEIRRLSHRLVLPALALNELQQILQKSQDAVRAAREQTPQPETKAE